MPTRLLTRRAVLKAAALTPPVFAAGSLAAPFVSGAYAAGSLSVGTWDHWVPGASQNLLKVCQEWASKEKVDLKVDLITSNGDKDLLTLMAEGQAKSGHDIMGLRTWYVASQEQNFVPVDDIVVLGIGVALLSRHRLQEREGRVLKLVSGLVMVGLGVYLVGTT